MAEEKIFANGFSFKRKESAPEFVVGRQSIKVDDAIAFLTEHQVNGWVNIDINQAKSGTYYCQLDNWKKDDAPKDIKVASAATDVPF
jgi:hypothetical protein